MIFIIACLQWWCCSSGAEWLGQHWIIAMNYCIMLLNVIVATDTTDCRQLVCAGDQQQYSLSNGSWATSNAQSNLQHGPNPTQPTHHAESSWLSFTPSILASQWELGSTHGDVVWPISSGSGHWSGLLWSVLLSAYWLLLLQSQPLRRVYIWVLWKLHPVLTTGHALTVAMLWCHHDAIRVLVLLFVLQGLLFWVCCHSSLWALVRSEACDVIGSGWSISVLVWPSYVGSVSGNEWHQNDVWPFRSVSVCDLEMTLKYRSLRCDICKG